MAHTPSPEDRPDPADRMPAVRARVPEHVALGQVSTGVIVVTGATEYVLDFVRNLPRPNIIVARVILPHAVMPQFADALATNISLYRQRYGDIPTGSVMTSGSTGSPSKPSMQIAASAGSNAESSNTLPRPAGPSSGSGISEAGAESRAVSSSNESLEGSDVSKADPASSGSSSNSLPPPTRHSSPQEVYDDLKLKDELLSGTYANAVMIGHGPYEFCFDFITNFYPQSAVSCRVFMASGHVGRLLDSLRASWDQLRPRLGG